MKAATEDRLVRPAVARAVTITGAATVLALALAALFPLGFSAQTSKAPWEAPPSSRRVVAVNHMVPNQAYSPAILAGKMLYLAGHLGRTPETQQRPPGIRDQTRHAMDNIGAVLRAAGMAYENLVKCHVYLASMDDYAGMNDTYRGYFPERVPARTTIEAAGLPQGGAVEISCVAYADVSGISVVRPRAGSLPAPLGPYSAAVWAGDTLYLSGMGGQFPDGRPLPATLAGQVTQTLANIETTLKAAGLSYSDVVSGESYVTVPAEAEAFDGPYLSAFASPAAHARATVFVPRLPGGIKSELTMVAARSSVGRRVIPPAGKGDTRARAMRAGDVLYTRTESGEDAGPGVGEQYRKVLERQDATLRAAGLGWTDVVDVQMYLSDLGDMDALNRIFRERFPHEPPARTTIRVVSRGARVQSSLVAVGTGAAVGGLLPSRGERMWSRRQFLEGMSTLPLVGGLIGGGGLVGAASAAPRAGRDYFTELGVRPFINAAGTYTDMTASLMPREVMEAIEYASERYVMLNDLHDVVGQRIASLLQSEAAMVTSGAASAMTLGTAAVLTGKDRQKIGSLPNLTDMKSEVIIQKAHRFGYERAVRNTGVRLIEVETPESLERAITWHTAMMLFYNNNNSVGQIPDVEFVRLGKKHGVPTFNDAAADVPPVENLWKYTNMGFDLVTFSGGKGLRGPQSAGLLLGRKDLIEAARMNAAPNGTAIGRGMKVNKEEILGMLVAVELFLEKDHAAERRDFDGRAEAIRKSATSVPGVQAEVFVPEVANHVPHLRVTWDAAKLGITPEEAITQLRDGKPSIRVRPSTEELVVGVWMMKPGEDAVVARRLREVLQRKS